jgi:hypothetical protein
MGAFRRKTAWVGGERAVPMQNDPGAHALGSFHQPCLPIPQRRYWQLVVKLSGNATTVTPRMVAPTSTN